MNKTQRVIAIFCVLATFNIYANDGMVQQQPAEKQEHESQSLYESIKSGWNKMLDVVVGPETPDNENNDN